MGCHAQFSSFANGEKFPLCPTLDKLPATALRKMAGNVPGQSSWSQRFLVLGFCWQLDLELAV